LVLKAFINTRPKMKTPQAKKMDRASPANGPKLLGGGSVKNLGDLGCASRYLLGRHIRLEPYVCAPTTKERGYHNHSKRYCHGNVHCQLLFP
jgi:hypothetical protein